MQQDQPISLSFLANIGITRKSLAKRKTKLQERIELRKQHIMESSSAAATATAAAAAMIQDFLLEHSHIPPSLPPLPLAADDDDVDDDHIDIDGCSSLARLEAHASAIEAELRDLVTDRTSRLDHVRECIEQIKTTVSAFAAADHDHEDNGENNNGSNKPRARKKCTSDGCTNVAHRGGVCVRHGAPLRRCSVLGCAKKSQKRGVCARHGANEFLPRCKVDGCGRFARKGGLCPNHGERCRFPGGCTSQIVRGGMCERHHRPPGGEGGYVRSTCRVEGCPRKVKNSGVCIGHGATQPRYVCSVEGCTSHVRRGGLCVRHGAVPCDVPECKNNAVVRGKCTKHDKEFRNSIDAKAESV